MGREPTESVRSEAWSGAYSPNATKAVYDELWRLADIVLSSGRPIVIDASFRTAAMREGGRRMAERHGVPFMLVECRAPRELIAKRLTARESPGGHESDARTDLLDEFEKRFEPIDELPPSEHLQVDTSQSRDETRRLLEATFAG
jgi:predicted kinase